MCIFKTILSLLLIGVFTTTSVAEDLLSSNLTYGKYQVGFKAVQTLDHTRPSLTGQSSPGRAMQLHIWYAQLLDWSKFYAEAYSNSAIPYTLQGRANLELGNKTEARALYEKALALLENDADLNAGEKSFFKTAIETRIESLNKL